MEPLSRNKRRRRSRRGSRNSSRNSSRRNSLCDDGSQHTGGNKDDSQSQGCWRQNDGNQNAWRSTTPQKQIARSQEREIVNINREKSIDKQSIKNNDGQIPSGHTIDKGVTNQLNYVQKSDRLSHEKDKIELEGSINKIPPTDINPMVCQSGQNLVSKSTDVNPIVCHSGQNLVSKSTDSTEGQGNSNVQDVKGPDNSLMNDLPPTHSRNDERRKSYDSNSEWKKIPEGRNRNARRKISDTVSPNIDNRQNFYTDSRQSPSKNISRRKSSDTTQNNDGQSRRKISDTVPPNIDNRQNLTLDTRQSPSKSNYRRKSTDTSQNNDGQSRRKVSDTKPPLNTQNTRKNSSEERKFKNTNVSNQKDDIETDKHKVTNESKESISNNNITINKSENKLINNKQILNSQIKYESDISQDKIDEKQMLNDSTIDLPSVQKVTNCPTKDILNESISSSGVQNETENLIKSDVNMTLNQMENDNNICSDVPIENLNKIIDSSSDKVNQNLQNDKNFEPLIRCNGIESSKSILNQVVNNNKVNEGINNLLLNSDPTTSFKKSDKSADKVTYDMDSLKEHLIREIVTNKISSNVAGSTHSKNNLVETIDKIKSTDNSCLNTSANCLSNSVDSKHNSKSKKKNTEVMPSELSNCQYLDDTYEINDILEDPTEEILTLKRKIKELQKELNRKIEENEDDNTDDVAKETSQSHLVESEIVTNEIDEKNNLVSDIVHNEVPSFNKALDSSVELTTSLDTTNQNVKSLSRAKQKGKHKQREMNQKGVEKEGTDMDAFLVDASRNADNNNRVSNDLSRLPTTESKANNGDNATRINQDIRNTDRPNDRSYDNSLTNSKNLADNNTETREKSPAQSQADATNNNINNQIAQKMEDTEDSGDDMVAAKNQENNMKNNLDDEELSDGSSQVISSSQASLKYQYKDDQWSPLNPQGKKVYDRDFLMKLREDPQSSKKPDITTDLEIFVKEGQMGAGSGGGGIRRNTSSHGSYSSFSNSSTSMRNTSNNILYPDFIRTSLSQRMPTKRNSQGGGGNRGPGGGQRSLKQMHSWNSRDEYKLNLSENAWKPSKLTRGQEIKTKEERDTEELHKKVRGILNKLTPQKFDTLVLQFQNLPINSLERLQGCIRLVFEKAVDEPAFSVSYANLCKVLARLQVYETQQIAATAAAMAAQPPNPDPNAPKPPQPVLFRKLLITRCQQEFETNKKLELDFEKRQQDINETPEPEKRKELQLLFNEEERKIRMKSVGLVTFIGELFKLKMLTANIMHGCIKQLLLKIDEESLECLCKLLTTIGREFEEQINNPKSGHSGISEFNDYFQQMAKLSRKHEGSRVSSRVRFMLQDVIELRQHNWVPRRDENKPRTMEQIQEEVDRESEKAAMLAAQPLRMSQNMNQDRGGNRRGNTRGNQSDDGWTNVGSKYSRNTNYAAEVTKIQGLRTTANMELDRGSRGETVLGPSMGYSKWGAGAGSSTRVQSSTAGFTDTNSFSALLDNAERKQAQPGTRLSALKMTNDSKEADKKEALLATAAFMRQPNSERESPRDNSRGRGQSGGSPSPSLSGPMRKPPLIEQPTSRPADMQRRTQSDTGRGGSTESSRESTPGLMSNLVDKSRVEPTPTPPIQPIDEDKLKQSATTIIEEYISNVNIQESVECYKEQFLDAGTLFVSTCLNYIVDQMKQEKRQKTSQLMGELMKRELFYPSLLVSELQAFFEMIYDLAVDIPHIWQYLGELFGDIMCIGVMDFSHLKEASQAIPDSSSDTNRLEATLREVFKSLLIEKLPVSVKELWDSSNVQLKDFISDKAASDKFLTDYGFLEGKDVVATDSKLTFPVVEEKLLGFLKSDENFDQICGWLTVHVGNRTAEPMFIRHLTEAVIKSSVSMDSATKSYKFDKNILNRNLKFIKRYVDNNEELELWCLYSVQYVVVISLESPSGMLVEIFRELYEGMVISPEGFNKWKQDDSRCPAWQNEGRGVAVASSKSFFQAMEQVMNDEQEDEPS